MFKCQMEQGRDGLGQGTFLKKGEAHGLEGEKRHKAGWGERKPAASVGKGQEGTSCPLRLCSCLKSPFNYFECVSSPSANPQNF